MIDWEEEVREYKRQYDDDGDSINEYVDNLVPIFYYDIKAAFNDMTYEIDSYHVKMPIWKVMAECIYNDYLENFMNAWWTLEEEE